MKISFETQTVSLSELRMIRNIIEQVEEQVFKTNTVTFPVDPSGDDGADRVYFAAREGVDSKVSVTIADIKTAEQFTEEFQPDDEDDVPSITDAQIAEMPCVKSGEASVEGIIREFEAITDIKVTRTVVPSVSSFVKDYVDAPSPESHDHQGHYQSQVVPPPPPAAAIAQVVPVPPQSTTITVSPPTDTQVVAVVPQGSAQSVVADLVNKWAPPVDEELDSDGKPWDATIHSETRAKNQDGTWRNRRRTKNVEVKQAIPGLEAITPNSVPAPPRERKMVRTFVYIDGTQDIIAAPEGATDAELSALTGKPTTRHAPRDVSTPIIDAACSVSPVVPAVPAVPPPPAAAPPVVKTAPQGAPVGTWAELMERVTKYFGEQKLNTKDLSEVCGTFGIGSIQECYEQQSLIPLVGAAIDAKAAANKAGA